MSKARNHRLKRFLSDFTIGFADGVTVPFALTAGLSSLGRVQTVIYAGAAELCAGSISMGIGGYLSAVDEAIPPSSPNKNNEDGMNEELHRMLSEDGIKELYESDATGHTADQSSGVLALLDAIIALPTHSHEVHALLLRLQEQLQHSCIESSTEWAAEEATSISPIASGLSISLGYVVGGIIPLLPYFALASVRLALTWSVVMCSIALLGFGAGKSWVLTGDASNWKRHSWKGAQMLALGSLAAGAAMLCVYLIERDSTMQ